MAKTKKPTGLTITRAGSKYTIKWKIADNDYASGQTLEYRTKGKKEWSKWHEINIGNATTTKSITLDKSDYYPYKANGKYKPYLTAVEFRVKGKRHSYRTGTGSSERTIIPDWSDWSEKTFTIDKPPRPKVIASLGESEHESVYRVNIPANDADNDVYSRYEWQTIRVTESIQTDGSKLKWSSRNAYWQTDNGTATNFTKTIAENSQELVQKSRTRWFRVRARGCAGNSDWTYGKHNFGKPFAPTIKGFVYSTKADNLLMTLNWVATQNPAHPIDEVNVEYEMAVPKANMAMPDPSWTSAIISKDSKGTDSATFYTDRKLDFDECLYAKVTAIHDDARETESTPKLLLKGNLAKPTLGTVTVTDGVATITATNNSTACIPETANASQKNLFLAVVYKDNRDFKTAVNIGALPVTQGGGNELTGTVRLPAYTDTTGLVYKIGVQAIVGTYTYTTELDYSRRYKINVTLKSKGADWQSATLPEAPSDVDYVYDGTDVIVRWNWSWNKATVAELSWAENPNAWESNTQPETYETPRKATEWRLSGLEVGKVYYIRIRLKNAETEEYSPYSAPIEVNLTLPPLKPVLVLSNPIITDQITASWVYNSQDGSEQAFAEIKCDGEVIGHCGSEKYITLYTDEQGWTQGEEYELTLIVKSESGSYSDESDPVAFTVAEPPTAEITSTSLVDETITDDEGVTREVKALKALPLTITATGSGEGGILQIVIERAESYRMDRPDESRFDGYEGETIYLIRQIGEEPVTVNKEDLMGAFDDGAKYRIIATVIDGIGQTATDELDFEVHWTDQAIIPDGTVTIEDAVAYIVPIAESPSVGATCDIYRLSTDKPELIYPNAEFGTTYVDPYPAIGGGYRFVYRTVDGDYITADNRPAWTDVESGFEYDKAIIDFADDRVELYYNVDASHNWSKDFKETHYLGGAIQGDWNAGVSRSTNISGVVLKPLETAIEGLRRLAIFTGICNVRTLDGSSFHANVEVDETNSHDRRNLISEFSLNVTRVDAEGYDGMTLSAWEEEQDELG